MEIATLAIMAVVAVALTAAGEPNALPIGYLVANAISAAVISAVFLDTGEARKYFFFEKKKQKTFD